MNISKTLSGLSILLIATSGSPAQDRSVFELRENLRDSPGIVMDAVGVQPGMVIGEIGSGWGRYAIPLAYRVGRTGTIYANDIRPERLEFINYRCRRNNIRNVTTILGKPDDPLFPENALMDMVFIVDTYYALHRPQHLFAAILTGLKSRLKPGGKVVLVHTIVVEDGELDQLTREARETGYSCEKMEDLHLGDYFLGEASAGLLRSAKQKNNPNFRYDEETGKVFCVWDVFVLKPLDKRGPTTRLHGRQVVYQ